MAALPTGNVVVTRVAVPAASVPVPNIAVPFLNVTTPVGVGPMDAVTVAVNVTDWPEVDGLPKRPLWWSLDRRLRHRQG